VVPDPAGISPSILSIVPGSKLSHAPDGVQAKRAGRRRLPPNRDDSASWRWV